MMLADLGAEILKIESPSIPDLIRTEPPFDGEEAAAHHYLSRSKQSMTLDLKQREAINLVKELIQDYDVLIEGFRPGVMERLGLDYETLKEVNPRLIYCSLTSFGQTGPYRDRPGHDNNFLALSGALHYSRRQLEPPVTMGIQVGDVAGGSLHTVIGILAAVIHREQTGKGQYVDVSMTDATFALNALYGSAYLACDVEPEPERQLLNGGTFYDYYETKDGRFFSVGSLEPSFRKKLCEALGLNNQLDLAFSRQPQDEISFKYEVRQAFLKKDFNEWLRIFESVEACVEPVLTFSEACHHEQIQARNMIVKVQKQDGSSQKQLAHPIKFSEFQPLYNQVGKRVGEDTVKVLEKLGYTQQQIEVLQQKGVFGTVSTK